MAILRKYKLSDRSQNVDLRQYQDEIVDTINEAVPDKHPKVYKDHFTTDQLTHSEAVRIGRALSKSDNLAAFGKTVTTFRLFSGTTVEVEDRPKGGRMR
ncbi:MAG: hypothetical protein HFF67_02020 [Oscillospiraceae bacterium]|uniref:hypothetical protein n=1 Tax=uncultured Bacteroides sp. TaxID=162156 RepID=UPI002172E622|nr:hypothetical protein [uncultured Bacteroides sp.]MCI9316796.1 hypothetical protein [Oscillospiraceae bacterium]